MIRQKLNWNVHLRNLEESVETMINSQRMVKGIEKTYLLDHWVLLFLKIYPGSLLPYEDWVCLIYSSAFQRSGKRSLKGGS